MTTLTSGNPMTGLERFRAPTAKSREETQKGPTNDLSSGPPEGALVESSEFEWTTALNLPGLIVSPSEAQRANPPAAPPMRRPLDHVVETEDGDATSCCQLPGLLGSIVGDSSPVFSAARAIDEAEVFDEYAEIAAMQLPGGLVEPSAAAEEIEARATVRGLCATCVHRDDCDFPRPSGGVWRCEEYA